jgi:Rap1a immunity proteins
MGEVRGLFTAGAVVVAVMVRGPATGEASRPLEDGNSLYGECKDLHLACVAYAVGIADAMSTGSQIGGYAACLQPNITRGQIGEVAIRFLAAHPELRHDAAAGLVARALAETFPCGL